MNRRGFISMMTALAAKPKEFFKGRGAADDALPDSIPHLLDPDHPVAGWLGEDSQMSRLLGKYFDQPNIAKRMKMDPEYEGELAEDITKFFDKKLSPSDLWESLHDHFMFKPKQIADLFNDINIGSIDWYKQVAKELPASKGNMEEAKYRVRYNQWSPQEQSWADANQGIRQSIMRRELGPRRAIEISNLPAGHAVPYPPMEQGYIRQLVDSVENADTPTMAPMRPIETKARGGHMRGYC